jgi:zinc transport system substrate-binding protein
MARAEKRQRAAALQDAGATYGGPLVSRGFVGECRRDVVANCKWFAIGLRAGQVGGVKRLGIFLVLMVAGVASFAAEGKLRVVTTFLPGFNVAANVAGDLAVVENLVAGNVSLHDFQLSPGELRKLNGADVVMLNGLGLETFLDRAVRSGGASLQRKFVTLTDGLHGELIHGVAAHAREEEGHDHGHDPHVWLDPMLMAHGVTNAMRAMQKADPANAEGYARNAAAYVAKLHALNAELKEKLAAVKGAPFITYHQAFGFGYFARRYGLNLAGVVERVPEIPPSTRERAELQKTIREKKVKALFAEPGGSSALAKSIAGDTGIRLGELDPLEMGVLSKESYVEGMRRNAEALVRGLK